MDNNSKRPGAKASLEEWKHYAQSMLPEGGCIFLENQKITALYAETYLRNPGCFKWAGMAAFASHHVRLALLPLRLSTGKTGCRDLAAVRRRYKPLESRDIELLRETNSGIFADIYWAHLVYDGKAPGLDDLARLLGTDSAMFQGFESIEQGRQLVEDGEAEAGVEKIWEGNKELLRHEQVSMVQPRFMKLSSPFAHAFSAASTLNFSAGGPKERVRLFCSFYAYMMKGGVLKRSRPPLMPMITHLPDRWSWIEHCILPKFRRFESSSDSPIEAQLHELIELGSGA